MTWGLLTLLLLKMKDKALPPVSAPDIKLLV